MSLQNIIGRKVQSAVSSLNNFSIAFSDGEGLALNALAEEGGTIQCLQTKACLLPTASDAVCSVDWSWIYGAIVENAEVGQKAVRLTLNPAGPLVIGLSFWQGKPFLSFQPYKAANH